MKKQFSLEIIKEIYWYVLIGNIVLNHIEFDNNSAMILDWRNLLKILRVSP